MLKEQKIVLFMLGTAVLFEGGAFVGSAIAQSKSATPKAQDKIALGEDEVKQLVLMMDTDKNGKISKAEFLNFMSAEFDRLDKDKSGELDVKELAQSQIRATRPAVGK